MLHWIRQTDEMLKSKDAVAVDSDSIEEELAQIIVSFLLWAKVVNFAQLIFVFVFCHTVKPLKTDIP